MLTRDSVSVWLKNSLTVPQTHGDGGAVSHTSNLRKKQNSLLHCWDSQVQYGQEVMAVWLSWHVPTVAKFFCIQVILRLFSIYRSFIIQQPSARKALVIRCVLVPACWAFLHSQLKHLSRSKSGGGHLEVHPKGKSRKIEDFEKVVTLFKQKQLVQDPIIFHRFVATHQGPRLQLEVRKENALWPPPRFPQLQFFRSISLEVYERRHASRWSIFSPLKTSVWLESLTKRSPKPFARFHIFSSISLAPVFLKGFLLH